MKYMKNTLLIFLLLPVGLVQGQMSPSAASDLFTGAMYCSGVSVTPAPRTPGGVVILDYTDRRGNGVEVSPAFGRRYTNIVELIQTGDLEEAEAEIQVLSTLKRGFHEDAWYWWINSVYLSLNQNSPDKLLIESLEKSLTTHTRLKLFSSYEIPFIEHNNYVLGSRMLFELQILNSDPEAAMATFNNLSQLGEMVNFRQYADNYEDVMASMEPTYQLLAD